MGNQEFSNWLFWDTDPNTLDFRQHKSHVNQRVVSMGTLENWKLLKRLYSSEEIIDASIKSKTLDKKLLTSFLSTLKFPKVNSNASRRISRLQNTGIIKIL